MPGIFRRDRRRGRRRGMRRASNQDDPVNMDQSVEDDKSSLTDDNVQQLEKLSELRDKGIINDKDYDKKKKQILDI
ncbi:MAG: SHOCT domain-containing protein [Methanobacterium sp.]